MSNLTAIRYLWHDAMLKDTQQLPDQAIDEGNSRTYLYAYIASR